MRTYVFLICVTFVCFREGCQAIARQPSHPCPDVAAVIHSQFSGTADKICGTVTISNVTQYLLPEPILCSAVKYLFKELCRKQFNMSVISNAMKKPESRICENYKEMKLGTNNTEIVPNYDKLFANNVNCERTCRDVMNETHPLCRMILFANHLLVFGESAQSVVPEKSPVNVVKTFTSETPLNEKPSVAKPPNSNTSDGPNKSKINLSTSTGPEKVAEHVGQLGIFKKNQVLDKKPAVSTTNVASVETKSKISDNPTSGETAQLENLSDTPKNYATSGKVSSNPSTHTEENADVQELTVKEDAVKEDAVKEDAVKEDAVKENAVKEDAVKEDAVKEDAVKEDAVKEDAVKEETDLNIEQNKEREIIGNGNKNAVNAGSDSKVEHNLQKPNDQKTAEHFNNSETSTEGGKKSESIKKVTELSPQRSIDKTLSEQKNTDKVDSTQSVTTKGQIKSQSSSIVHDNKVEGEKTTQSSHKPDEKMSVHVNNLPVSSTDNLPVSKEHNTDNTGDDEDLDTTLPVKAGEFHDDFYGEGTGIDDDRPASGVLESGGGTGVGDARLASDIVDIVKTGVDPGTAVLDESYKYEADDSHFFAYFMTTMIFCIVGYLLFHNKQKILALALEGRARRGRRRPNTSGYRKLDSNLEEAIGSSKNNSVTQIIY